jgi:spermidine synthase
LGQIISRDAGFTSGSPAHRAPVTWSVGVGGSGEVVATAANAFADVRVRTWPASGYAVVDVLLMTPNGVGSTPASTELYTTLLGLFAQAVGGKLVHTKWSSRGRGIAGQDDRDRDILGSMHLDKKLLQTHQSEYQHIEIWGINDQQEWTHHDEPADGSVAVPEYNAPTLMNNKMLFLDGVVQSGTEDEKVYHESLVHPAMVTHERGAERVGILGGGEGATLREILKYTSVKEVVMIELDQGVIDVCRENQAELSNCSWTSTDGTFSSCFDDPRSTIVTQDAVKYIKERFGEDACAGDANADNKFDVLILDLLDPDLLPDTGFAKFLYSKAFMEQLKCTLKEDGIFVAQFGEAPIASQVRPEEVDKVGILVQSIAPLYLSGGFYVYETYVPTFRGKWSFALGCKTNNCANRFNDNSAAIDLALRQRIDPRVGHGVVLAGGAKNSPKLEYFDGSTMQVFQQTPKAYETAYCYFQYLDLKDGDADDRALLDADGLVPECSWAGAPSAEDGQSTPESFITLKDNVVADKDGGLNRGAAAARNLAKGTILGLHDAATTFQISRTGLEKLKQFAKTHKSPEYSNLVEWLNTYGYACDINGGQFFVARCSGFF